MATTNFTGDGKQQTYVQLICSPGLTTGIHGKLTFIAVLNIFLSITAFLGNALILAALRKESTLHPTSKLLLRSLATTDLCVGLISEPLAITYLMSAVNEHWNICRYVLTARYITDPILCGVSLLTLTAISVDRLLALLLGLRYRQVVTLKRTYVIVITFWVVSAVFSAMYFWNVRITMLYSILLILLCLVTSVFSYTKIFYTLRHHQSQVQDLQQPNQTNQLNIARYRKAVSSTLWLQLTLVACYLPRGLVSAFLSQSELSIHVYLTAQYSSTLLFFNSSLNPILYCWKIAEVRQAVKDTIRQVLCCSLSQLLST
ncbi:adenosine receptor A3-like [Oculina patagonica]